MKKYNLQLLSKKISLGELEISIDESQARINLAEEAKDYRGGLVRLIKILNNDGKFGIEFNQESLEIEKITPLFIEALKQGLMRELEVYLERTF